MKDVIKGAVVGWMISFVVFFLTAWMERLNIHQSIYVAAGYSLLGAFLGGIFYPSRDFFY